MKKVLVYVILFIALFAMLYLTGFIGSIQQIGSPFSGQQTPSTALPGTTSLGSFALSQTFSPEPAKSVYKISFVVIEPTNAKNYNFNDADLQQVVSQMNNFWNEMSHGKVSLIYDKKYTVNFPGQITCLKPSECPESWPNVTILSSEFDKLGITSDIVVALVDVDIVGIEAAASSSFETSGSLTSRGIPVSVVGNWRSYSVIFDTPKLFQKSIDQHIRTLSHEIFHTQKFLLARDAYVGAPRLIPPSSSGIPAEYYSVTEDLMGGGMLTSYLAGYKRAELGWETYMDLDASGKSVTFDIKPNCLDDVVYRIPLGIAKNPPIEWYEANKYNDIYYHSIFLEWVRNSACKWEKTDLVIKEGIRATEVYEIYDYYTKRYHAVYERDITNTITDFDSDKISIKFISKETNNIRLEVKTNLQKQTFTSQITGQVYKWSDQCSGTQISALGLIYNTSNGLFLMLQSNKDNHFVNSLIIDQQTYGTEKYTTWVRGVYPISSNCPNPPYLSDTRADWTDTFSEFEKCDFSIILLDSLGNYYKVNFKNVFPNCS